MEDTALKAELPLSPDRIEFLEETGRALGRAVELTAVATVALDALVPAMADMAVLVVNRRDGPPHVAVTHARSSASPRLEREVRGSLDAILRSAARNAVEGRHTHWLPRVTDTTARALTRDDPRLHSLIHTLGLRSLIIVSLRSGGQSIGGLALGRSKTTAPFHGGDFATVQVLARRIALALDSAMLQEHLQQHLHRAPAITEVLDKWVRVFDVAWWGAAIVDAVDQRIEAVNPAFARLYGHGEPDALVGRPFAELVPAERTGELQEWKSGSEGLVYESEHRRSDGGVVPVLVSVTPLYDDRRAGTYVVTVQDLSDLKRAEERLRRAQRMEAVGRLAGGVAHEVNNMMTIILGFSDLLSQRGAPADDQQRDDEQRELEEIRKAALRAAKITSQLLAFSRQQVLQPSDLRLNRVVEEMETVLRLMLPANVRVETALAPLDAVVRVDRSQIEQVLINLAFNARDAMTSGGTIRITTESRRLDEEAGLRLIGIPIPPGSYGLISVIDTGHGMDADTLAHVFEPFFTTKPSGSGTGLGLSTVYGIVKQSGGYVWADSTPGQGTTFTVCLPEVSGTAGERPAIAPATPKARASGETVLVLEDEDGVRELTTRVLQDRGYEVVQARNGNEALARLRDGTATHNLLLTDVIVPDMGTEQLEGEVHRILPGLPILYMSGYPKDDILARGLLRGDQPFLQKPFTGEDLAAEVGRMIQQT